MEPPTPTLSEATLTSPIQARTDRNAENNFSGELVTNAKVSLDALSAAFESLHGQTMQIANLNGSAGTKEEITNFRQELREQEDRHKEGMAEIQRIIDDLLETQIVEQLRFEVEQEISEQIDEIVKERVAECLKAHIPKELQDEVEESKGELERSRLALHNSESRRMNGLLRSEKPYEHLDPLLMSNGHVSTYFPKDLRSLFNLDAETCKALALDYELPDISDSRNKNLNRLLQFCGVRSAV